MQLIDNFLLNNLHRDKESNELSSMNEIIIEIGIQDHQVNNR